jgi:hypothetical protein
MKKLTILIIATIALVAHAEQLWQLPNGLLVREVPDKSIFVNGRNVPLKRLVKRVAAKHVDEVTEITRSISGTNTITVITPTSTNVTKQLDPESTYPLEMYSIGVALQIIGLCEPGWSAERRLLAIQNMQRMSYPEYATWIRQRRSSLSQEDKEELDLLLDEIGGAYQALKGAGVSLRDPTFGVATIRTTNVVQQVTPLP